MDVPVVRAYLERLAEDSRARALGLSIAFHCLLFLFVETGYRAGWWRESFLSLLQPQNQSLKIARKKESPPDQHVPLVFVDVDPSVATPDPPQETKYYSSQNSKAGNPDNQLDSETPKITGTQEVVPRTTQQSQPAPKPTPAPLQPAPTVAETQADPVESPAPEPALPEAKAAVEPPKAEPTPSGDLAMARPVERPAVTLTPQPAEPTESERPAQPRRRPMRIAEALQQQGMLAGERMKQEGGVKRFSIAEGLDVKATPFGAYDAAIIAAIQQRWYDLLEDRDYARNQTGRVVLTFKLMSDGSVTEMRVAENTVSEILALICQRAVLDPAPFARWPSDLRRLIGGDSREVRFTFHYN